MEEFLASLQMEEYLDGFLKHGFADIELMMDLTPDQLKDCFAEVNVTLLGHYLKGGNNL